MPRNFVLRPRLSIPDTVFASVFAFAMQLDRSRLHLHPRLDEVEWVEQRCRKEPGTRTGHQLLDTLTSAACCAHAGRDLPGRACVCRLRELFSTTVDR